MEREVRESQIPIPDDYAMQVVHLSDASGGGFSEDGVQYGVI